MEAKAEEQLNNPNPSQEQSIKPGEEKVSHYKSIRRDREFLGNIKKQLQIYHL